MAATIKIFCPTCGFSASTTTTSKIDKNHTRRYHSCNSNVCSQLFKTITSVDKIVGKGVNTKSIPPKELQKFKNN